MSSQHLPLILERLDAISARLAQQNPSHTADCFSSLLLSALPHLAHPDKAIEKKHNNIPINLTVDHTLLKQEATSADIAKLCAEAFHHNFYSVCVNGCWVAKANEELDKMHNANKQQRRPLVAAVVGFPLGATTSATKAFECGDLIACSASELDMVVNVGALVDGDANTVYKDILGVVNAAKAANKDIVVKVIIESSLLNSPSLIVDACLLSALAGANFVKTSTGFNATGGAKLAHVELMKATVGDSLRVKASGGIRDLKAAQDMINAGAERLGTSAGIEIIKGNTVEAGKY